MPAKSKAQRGLMGMALAKRRGKLKDSDIPDRVRGTVQRLAKDKDISLEDFTSTKEKNLPRRVTKASHTRSVRSA